jgi:hypothetical protein
MEHSGMDNTTVAIPSIRTDGGTQPRSMILRDVVEEYAVAMADGAIFPPIIAFYDGTHYWLADGFHRLAAAEAAGRAVIACEVRQGTRRDAVLHSVGANAAHGMRRTNDDKRRAVRVLLEDAEWGRRPETWMAEKCGVSRTLVRAVLERNPHLVEKQDRSAVRDVMRNGTAYTLNTGNIGSNPPPRPRPDAPVFDSTPAGVASNWTPADIPDQSARPSRDASGDYIHHILTEIARQFARLPSVTDAADLYPVDLSHALPVSAVNSIADWFSEFAPLWESGHPDRQEWARNIIEKVKETSVVSTQ